jgi:hypothetical protein
MGEPFMTVYVVGQVKFTDRAAYQRYAARFRRTQAIRRKVFAADEQPEIIEGRLNRASVFFKCDGFPQVLRVNPISGDCKGPKAGADTLLLLVHGIDGGGG